MCWHNPGVLVGSTYVVVVSKSTHRAPEKLRLVLGYPCHSPGGFSHAYPRDFLFLSLTLINDLHLYTRSFRGG